MGQPKPHPYCKTLLFSGPPDPTPLPQVTVGGPQVSVKEMPTNHLFKTPLWGTTKNLWLDLKVYADLSKLLFFKNGLKKCIQQYWVIDVWSWCKKCDRTAAGKEEDHWTSLGLGFWFIAALCTMISPSPPIPVHKRCFPRGIFTLSVKPLPHFKTSSTLKPLPLLQHHHHSYVHI